MCVMISSVFMNNVIQKFVIKVVVKIYIYKYWCTYKCDISVKEINIWMNVYQPQCICCTIVFTVMYQILNGFMLNVLPL